MDIDQALKEIAQHSDVNPYQRVHTWREILQVLWRRGFDAGYVAARSDVLLSEDLAEKEAKPND